MVLDSRGGLPVRLFALAAVLAALLVPGCGGPSLSYDASPGSLVVEVASSGGLAPVYTDDVSSFRAWGDGRVVKATGDGMNGELIEGKLGDGGVEGLLERMDAAGFFGLKSAYRDDRVMDGVTVTVTASLKSGGKTVSVYMEEVPAFAATVEAIERFPVTGEHAYVPDQGYLLVTGQQQAPEKPRVPPSDVSALLPNSSELRAAAANGKPVAVPGSLFAKLKNWESTQEYPGIDVESDGTWYRVFPVYEPLQR